MAEALDNTSLNFTTTGTWTVSATGGLNGQDALVSDGSEVHEVKTTVTGPGWFVFWTQTGYSGLQVLVDGAAVDGWQSGYSWSQRGYLLPGAEHEVVIRMPAGAKLMLDHLSMVNNLDGPLDGVFPDFTWTTGGASPWVGNILGTTNLNGKLRSYRTDSWLETTVTGPGRLQWDGNGGVKFLVDGKGQSGYTYTNREQLYYLSAGTHVLRWLNPPSIAGGQSVVELNSVKFTPGVELSIAEAVHAPTLQFNTGGAAEWTAQQTPLAGAASPFSGAVSGLVEAGETTWIETLVDGPGLMVSKGSSSLNYLLRNISVDGVPYTGGEGMNAYIPVSPGRHAVRWSLTRLTSYYDYPPQAYLSQVAWTPLAAVSFNEALDLDTVEFSSPNPLTEVYGHTVQGQDDVVEFQNGGQLVAKINGPGVLAFSQAYGFNLFLDGVKINPTDSIDIPPGQHEFAWVAVQPMQLARVSFAPGSNLTISEALGGLAWQASPEVSAFKVGTRSRVNLFLPQAGRESRLYGLESTFNGPGVLSFSTSSWLTSGLEVRFDGVLQHVPNFYLVIPSGSHTIKFSAPANALTGETASVVMASIWGFSWTAEQSVSLAEAVDAPQMIFTTGGSGSWEGIANATGDFARLSMVTGPSWIETTVAGTGIMRFTARTGYPYTNISITVDAQPVNAGNFLELATPGPHTVRWTSGPVSSASELDAVSWEPYEVKSVADWPAGAAANFTTNAPGSWAWVDNKDADTNGSLHATRPSAWLEGQFRGPAALEFEMLGSVLDVDVDGGTRHFTANGPSDKWRRCRIILPAGTHTVRWSSGPLFYEERGYVDKIRLVPAAPDYVSAVELPGSDVPPGPGLPRWLPVLDDTLPDGDGLVSEGGLSESTYTEKAALQLPVTGLSRVSVHFKSDSTLDLRVVDSFPNGLVTVSDSADGWRIASLVMCPGTRELTAYVFPEVPSEIDHIEVTDASQNISASTALQIPDVIIRTNPENPFVTLPADATQTLYAGIGPDRIAPWLEMEVTGPGIVHSDVQSFGGSLDLTIDSTDDVGDLPGKHAILLGAGTHRLRWTLNTLSTHECPMATFRKPSFTPTVAFIPNGVGSMICSEKRPVSLTEIDGRSVLRLPAGFAGDSANFRTSALIWTLKSAGLVKLNWKQSEDAPTSNYGWVGEFIRLERPSEQGESKTMAAWGDSVFAGPETLYTRGWREWTSMTSNPGAQYIAQIISNQGLDITTMTFDPAQEVPVAEAIGLPGINFTTSGTEPWLGFRSASERYVMSSSLPRDTYEARDTWMEATVTGPVEITWREPLADSYYPRAYVSALVVGTEFGSRPLDWLHPTTFSIQVPPGPQIVRWTVFDPSYGYYGPTFRLDHFEQHPISATYEAWRPLVPGGVTGTILPPGGDEDRDGLTNLMEFAYHTDPFHATPRIAPVLAKEGNQFTVCLPEPRPLSDGVKVTIQISPDLTNWTDANVTSMPAPAPGKLRFSLALPANVIRQLYVRTRVELVGP